MTRTSALQQKTAINEIHNAIADDNKKNINYESGGVFINRLAQALSILFDEDPIPPQIDDECKTVAKLFLDRHKDHFSKDAVILLTTAINGNRTERQWAGLPTQLYPFGLRKEMSISEVEHCLDSVTGLSWNRDSVYNTIIIRNVSLKDLRHCDLICKFGFVDNLYKIHYRDSRR